VVVPDPLLLDVLSARDTSAVAYLNNQGGGTPVLSDTTGATVSLVDSVAPHALRHPPRPAGLLLCFGGAARGEHSGDEAARDAAVRCRGAARAGVRAVRQGHGRPLGSVRGNERIGETIRSATRVLRGYGCWKSRPEEQPSFLCVGQSAM
jgi:hypothetical protein